MNKVGRSKEFADLSIEYQWMEDRVRLHVDVETSNKSDEIVCCSQNVPFTIKIACVKCRCVLRRHVSQPPAHLRFDSFEFFINKKHQNPITMSESTSSTICR